MIPPENPPPYTPATYIVAGSPLTALQLVSQYEEFRDSLRYISTAPELVFERLVANLNAAFSTGLELERRQHATDIQMLQLSNSQLKEELAELKGTAQVEGSQENPQTSNHTSDAVVRVKNPIIGTFHTSEVRPCSGSHPKTSKVVSFAKPYSAPPGLPVGLTMVDIESPGIVRVKSYASKIQQDCFEIHADTWGGTMLYQASCAWLEVEANDPDIQFGSYDSQGDTPGRPNSRRQRKIIFSRPYPTPPIVVVWLAGFNMSRGGYWRLETYATDVTTTSFIIHFDSWSDTELEYGLASWLAYPVNRAGIISGRFSTLDLRPHFHPQLLNTGYENFGLDVFAAPPRTFLAINSLDTWAERNMRVSVKASSVSAAGMTWHIDSWGDTNLQSAGVSYIALS